MAANGGQRQRRITAPPWARARPHRPGCGPSRRSREWRRWCCRTAPRPIIDIGSGADTAAGMSGCARSAKPANRTRRFGAGGRPTNRTLWIIGVHHTFGLIRTAISEKISIFQSSSLKAAPISPNASCVLFWWRRTSSTRSSTSPSSGFPSSTRSAVEALRKVFGCL